MTDEIDLSEKDVKKLVKKWLDGRGSFWFSPVSNGMGKHGIPDFISCVPVVVTQAMVGKRIGAFLAIETKAGGRRGEKDGGCTPMQALALIAIREAKGCAGVIDGAEQLSELDADIDSFWERGE